MVSFFSYAGLSIRISLQFGVSVFSFFICFFHLKLDRVKFTIKNTMNHARRDTGNTYTYVYLCGSEREERRMEKKKTSVDNKLFGSWWLAFEANRIRGGKTSFSLDVAATRCIYCFVFCLHSIRDNDIFFPAWIYCLRRVYSFVIKSVLIRCNNNNNGESHLISTFSVPFIRKMASEMRIRWEYWLVESRDPFCSFPSRINY